MNRLITFRPSHYCEKARWALDRAAIPYREESHIPFFSWLATFGSGAGRTVPALVADGKILPDSTGILRWVDAQGGAPPLFPDANVAALEEDFDAHLGPATRRLVYFHLRDERARLRQLLATAGPRWEARATTVVFPLIRLVIPKGLNVSAEGAERSRRVVDETFARVAGRLADGRRYLAGDDVTAADLTFAALAYPVVWPDGARHLAGPLEEVPAALRAVVEGYRATAAGRFALRLWGERGPTSCQNPAP